MFESYKRKTHDLITGRVNDVESKIDLNNLKSDLYRKLEAIQVHRINGQANISDEIQHYFEYEKPKIDQRLKSAFLNILKFLTEGQRSRRFNETILYYKEGISKVSDVSDSMYLYQVVESFLQDLYNDFESEYNLILRANIIDALQIISEIADFNDYLPSYQRLKRLQIDVRNAYIAIIRHPDLKTKRFYMHELEEFDKRNKFSGLHTSSYNSKTSITNVVSNSPFPAIKPQPAAQTVEDKNVTDQESITESINGVPDTSSVVALPLLAAMAE